MKIFLLLIALLGIWFIFLRKPSNPSEMTGSPPNKLPSIELAPIKANEKIGPTVAKEGESFDVGPTGAVVEYGAKGSWVRKKVYGRVVCDNDTFTDPIYGELKTCRIITTS